MKIYMKNNYAIIRCFLPFLLVLILLFCTAGIAFSVGDSSFGQSNMPYNIPGGNDIGGTEGNSGGSDDDYVAGEVLAPADSWEQAQAIAEAYGLKLKSYAYGVAVLAALNPEQTVAQSVSVAAAAHNQSSRFTLPELSLNYIYYFDEIVEANIADNEYDIYDANYTWELFATAYGEEQWHHDFMDSELAWDITTGEGVIIAILDTGIDIDHPKFAGKILPNSYNSYTDQIGLSYVRDDHGHGTHVSGIAAASMEGDAFVCGVAPDASILAIKTNIPGAGSLTVASWVRGLNYAVENGADVANMSFGGPYAYAIAQNAITNAVARGIIIVCAAGNDSANNASYPAAYPETMAVSALEPSGWISSFSNYGPQIDVAAPGRNIYAPKNGGGYVNMSGTSMASPCVVGVAALIKSLHPDCTAEQFRDILRKTARKVGPAEWDEYYGYGLVNAYAALLGDDSICSVTFDFNDGIHAPITIKSVCGVRLVKLDYPIRDGHFFGGWFTSPDGGEEFDFSARITEDMTLYAKWGIVMPGMFGYEIPDPVLCQVALRWIDDQGGGYKNPMSIMADDDINILRFCEAIDISGQDVRTLKGIEYFTWLDILNCSNNRLADVDLSKNIYLTILNLSGNRLTELDISKQTGLLNLYCSSNILTKLDLSTNTDLRYLYCDSNRLESLNISRNSALRILNCDFNKLTELDVSKQPYMLQLSCANNELIKLDLTKLTQLRILFCESNQLTALDMSGNLRLEWFTCSYNQLTELDLSQQEYLTIINCNCNLLTKLAVPQNSRLKWLLCQDNLLTELNVSGNISLEWLYCNYNYIESVDDVIGWRLCPRLILNKTFLFSPQYRGKLPVGEEITDAFKDANFLAAVREIIGKPNEPIFDYDVFKITYLNIASRNVLDLSGIEYFVNLLQLNCKNNQLTELDMTNNLFLTNLDCRENLLTALNVSENSELALLYCQNNHLTGLDVTTNNALTYLDCSYNNMKTTDDVIGWEQINLRLGSTFKFFYQNGHIIVETPTITKQPENITVSQGGNATLTVLTEVSRGVLSYQWYNSGIIGPFGPMPINGATNASYDAPTDRTGTATYYCTITNTDDSADGSKTASARSNNASVTVTASTLIHAQTPSITSQPMDKTVNVGDTAALSISATVAKGTLSYQWYSNTSKTNSGGIIINGATGASYNAPTTTAGTSYYYCAVTNTDNEASGNKTATVTSNAVQITVKAVLTGIAVSSLPAKTLYIQGAALNLAGMTITATYSDNSTQAVLDYITNPANGATLNTAGAQTVTVSYTEDGITKLTYFTVTVEAPPKTLDHIEVTTLPAKTLYIQGEALNLAGMAITATYSDNSTQAVLGYITNPANGAPLNTVGAQSITVSYTEDGITKLTYFTVTVEAAVLLGDINGDGRINLSDLSFLAQYFIGGYGIAERFPMIFASGDMDRNGVLELNDLYLLTYLIVNTRFYNGQLTIDNGQQIESQATIISAFEVATPVDGGDTVIVVPEINGKPGEMVSIPVVIENSPGVTMYQLAMQYDNSKLEFISQTSGPAFAQPASLRNGGPIQVDGDIWEARVTYLGELLAPQTVSGDVVLCEFEFAIRDSAAAGETPLTLKPQNSYILSGSGNNVYPEIKNGAVTIAAEEEKESYNFRAYMEAAQTSLKAGETFSVDIMLTGDLNYTQLSAAIAYDDALLEFAGYANLGGLVAEVKKDGAGKINVRSVASLNMMTGASCVKPVRVVTLKFTVKGNLAAGSGATDLGFASIAVIPVAGVTGAITAPGKPLRVTFGW